MTTRMVTGLIMAIFLFAELSSSAVLQSEHDLDNKEMNSDVHQDVSTDTGDESIPSGNVTTTGEKPRRSKRSCPCCNGEANCGYLYQEWNGCEKTCYFRGGRSTTVRYFRGMRPSGCMDLSYVPSDRWCSRGWKTWSQALKSLTFFAAVNSFA